MMVPINVAQIKCLPVFCRSQYCEVLISQFIASQIHLSLLTSMQGAILWDPMSARMSLFCVFADYCSLQFDRGL